MSVRDPLFLRFVNGKASPRAIMQSFHESAEDKNTKEIISEFLDEEEPDLSQFKEDFAKCLEDIIRGGADGYVRNYLTNYMEPSLTEYGEENSFQTSSNVKRWVGIKDKNAPWIEGLVCYNLCMFIKAFDVSSIKKCPVCQSFFAHKGKYAKYCSEECKSSGRGK